MNPETGKTLRWLLVLSFVSGMIFFLIYKVEDSLQRTQSAASARLDQILAAVTGNTTNMISGRAVIDEKKDIAELSLMEMRMNAVREMENTGALLKYVPLGTKRVVIRAHYKVKAGYKLTPGVSLRSEDGELVAKFPKAEILGVELLDFKELENSDGWANKVTGDDRAWLMREIKAQMQEEVAASGMLEEVESKLRTRLQDLIGHPNVRIEHETATP